MSNIEFQNAIPEEFVLQAPTSTSKSILRKNLMEVLPVGSADYSSGQNATIAFQISSNSDILCGAESYFRFDFRNTTNSAVLIPATQFQEPALAFDVGGINSLFKSIEVRALGNGITLQRYDDYNCYNALASLIYDTEQDVMENHVAGDDIDPTESRFNRPVDCTTAAWTAATGTLTGVGTKFLQEGLVGKMIQVSLATYSWTGLVRSVTNDTVLVMSGGPQADVGATNADIFVLSLTSVGQHNWRRWFHSYISSSGSHVVIFKPRVSLLQHNLPLFLMKGGIEIIFELADGGRGIQVLEPTNLATDSAATLAYTISRPRYFAQMLTPHPDIIDEYIRQWKSSTGLVYSIPSVRSRQISGSIADASGTSLNYSVGVRSARRAYLVVRPSTLAAGPAANAVANRANSVSAFPRTKIISFQSKIGSHEYPNRAVQTLSTNTVQHSEYSEAWKHLMMVAGPCRGNRRLKYHQFTSSGINYYLVSNSSEDATTVQDSRHFIMAFDFSRDKGLNGDLTGADLSIVPLAIDLIRSAAASEYTGATFLYQLFVEHDSFLKISSEQMSVMN